MQNASTYGFRGEALYSLGLTSMLEIQSRCAGKESHAKVGCRTIVRALLVLQKHNKIFWALALDRICRTYEPTEGVLLIRWNSRPFA